VPLQQLEARYALRAARPDGEAVEDEVQYALAAEAAQLAAVSAQLSQRVDAADTQIARLDELSAALLQNIADKEAAMSLEEKVALLDGRVLAAVPPTPSVLSVSGGAGVEGVWVHPVCAERGAGQSCVWPCSVCAACGMHGLNTLH
jgi:hypothetical protein